MKKLTLLLLLFVSLLGFSQNKDAINYQSVIRNGSGIIVNQLVNIKLSILEASAHGDVVYSETHLVTSNDYGIISLQIGNGSTELGDYSAINWGSANHFLKIEIDETGGNDFVFMGTNQFLSVPYALSAKTAEDVDDADADSQNEIQTLERIDNTLTLSKSGGSVSIADNDNDSLNEIQTLELVGNQLKISDGNSVTITGTIDLDADPTNEFQNLTLKGDSVLIANGTGIELPPTGDIDSTNEFQNLSLKDDSILISNGKGIALNDNDSLNEIQMLSISNDTVFLENGGFVKLPVSIDNDSLNEIQLLSISNDTVFLKNGGFVKLPTYIDNDTTNELQVLSRDEDTLRLSNGNYILLPENLDNDSTNEIQELVLKNDSIIISQANGFSFVDLSPKPRKYSLGIDTSLGGYVFYLTPDSLHGYVFALDFTGVQFKYADATYEVNNPDNFSGIGKNFVDWEIPNKMQLLNINYLNLPITQVNAITTTPYYKKYVQGWVNIFLKGYVSIWNSAIINNEQNTIVNSKFNIIPVRKF